MCGLCREGARVHSTGLYGLKHDGGTKLGGSVAKSERKRQKRGSLSSLSARRVGGVSQRTKSSPARGNQLSIRKDRRAEPPLRRAIHHLRGVRQSSKRAVRDETPGQRKKTRMGRTLGNSGLGEGGGRWVTTILEARGKSRSHWL